MQINGKAYALSSIRVAYLCCSPHLPETLKHRTRPWAISLPAQAAAITALKDVASYNHKYTDTHSLRDNLKQKNFNLGIVEVVDGMSNVILITRSLSAKKIFF